MTSSENGTARPIRTSELKLSELPLRLSRGNQSKSLPEIAAAVSSSSYGSSNGFPASGSRPPDAPTSSSLPKPRSPSNLRSSSHERSSFSSQGSFQSVLKSEGNEAHRQIIVRSFAPRVATFASADTEAFVKQKGFKNGLYSLLRPFGESSHGKVVIRDSVGGSKGWDDFGIRFIDSQELQLAGAHSARSTGEPSTDEDSRGLVNGSHQLSGQDILSQINETGASIERILDHHLRAEDRDAQNPGKHYSGIDSTWFEPRVGSSPFYPFYLRKLLSSTPLVPYETFSHPVACLIAVSSHHPAPIEALRQLYANTGHGSNKTPAWVGTEYLRYYVLIHDEENGDITKSTALFDLMKRHFGLHCHLLRLKSSQCVPTDDDSIRVPSCEWLSAEEEMAQLRTRGRLKDNA